MPENNEELYVENDVLEETEELVDVSDCDGLDDGLSDTVVLDSKTALGALGITAFTGFVAGMATMPKAKEACKKVKEFVSYQKEKIKAARNEKRRCEKIQEQLKEAEVEIEEPSSEGKKNQKKQK